MKFIGKDQQVSNHPKAAERTKGHYSSFVARLVSIFVSAANDMPKGTVPLPYGQYCRVIFHTSVELTQ